MRREEEVSGKGEDVEKLRNLFNTITEFLSSLKQPLKELLDTIMESLSGEKLGTDVALFYRKLKEGGVPEELAKEMTKEYLKRRLETVPALREFLSGLGKPPYHKLEVEEEGQD